MVNEILDDPWVLKALREDYKGQWCSFCEEENDLADDCGWFIIKPTGEDEGYCCRTCWDGEPGKKHRKKYGIGER